MKRAERILGLIWRAPPMIELQVAHRLEAEGVQHVLRRLVLDPEQPRRGHQRGDIAAQPVGGAHKTDDRQARPDRQQRHRRAAAAELGIERERAGGDLDRDRRAGAVADDQDFVGVGVAHRRDDMPGKALDPCVDIGVRGPTACCQLKIQPSSR